MGTSAQAQQTSQTDPTAPNVGRSPLYGEVTMGLVTLAAETLIGLAALWDNIAIGWLLIGHLAVVAGLGLWLRRRLARGDEVSGALLLILVTLVAGPIGAVGALLALPIIHRHHGQSPMLDAWYERISMSVAVDPEAKLAESVLSGRTLEVAAPPPARLVGIMQRGSLIERQKALGLIARKFDPAYSLALQAALKSPEPVVRVQAAAVAARVRGALKADVRAMLAAIADTERDAGRAAETAARLEGCAASGLLDEGDRVRAQAAVARLRSAAARLTAEAPSGGVARLPKSLAAAREAERALLAAGRYRDLRIARRADALARRGFVVRSRGARRERTAAAAPNPIADTAIQTGAAAE